MATARASRLPTGTLTFVFTDIEGSTELVRALGDDYPAALAAHADALRRATAAHGGTEVSTEGDAFFVVFPAAAAAVEAAVEAQRKLASISWPRDVRLRVRMGMHTGRAELGGDNYAGIEVNRAARVAAAGHGGQVLLSDAARAQVEHDLPAGVSLRALGEYRLKGLERPLLIHELVVDGLPADFPALAAPRVGNLPTPLATFIGREVEMDELERLAHDHRLVTLVGPGGTGKTRLAVEVARRLAEATAASGHFVDLAPIRDATLVPLSVAHDLEVGLGPGDDAAEAVEAYLGEREAVVVLDNFEQVVDAAPFVERLVTAAPGVRVLVTSRTPLDAYGEQIYEVSPLPLPGAADDPGESPAVRLFVERAASVTPSFALTAENASAVAAIAARLDGLPLAIELAAGQLRLLSPVAIRDRLEAHLPLPRRAARDRPARQRSVDDAIAWSHDLLDEDERRLFARLATLPGGCTIDSATAVGGDDLGRDPLELLDGLVAKSLLRRVDRDDEARFGMLETILDFARARLHESRDRDATERRAAAFFAGFAAEAERQLEGRGLPGWLDRCARELPNLRRVLAWCAEAGETTLGLGMATSLERFWRIRGPLWEGRRIFDALLASGNADDAVRGRALAAAATLAWWDGDPEAALRATREAVSAAESAGQMDARFTTAYSLAVGSHLLWQGVLGGGDGSEADRAERLFGDALALSEKAGDERGAGRALRGLGQVVGIARGDVQAALPLFERSVDRFRRADDPWELNESLVVLGNAFRFNGKPQQALASYLEAIDLMAASGSRQVTASELVLVAALESGLGQHERAVRLFGGSEVAERRYGALRPPGRARLVGDPVGAARAAIGDDAVERELAAGRAMETDDLLAFARAGLGRG